MNAGRFRCKKLLWAAVATISAGTAIAFGSVAIKTITDETTRLDYLNPGEALWYGVPLSSAENRVNWHLPLTSLAAAALYDHAPRMNQALPLLTSVLFVALCGEIFSPILAAAALPLWVLADGLICFPQSALILLVFLVSGLLVFHDRKPSMLSTWAAALALGFTLLFRSTLAFFPPVLAGFEALLSWKRKGFVAKKEILVILLVPYLFLLPWIAMNASLYKKFIPLEAGEANSNVVAGALGLVGTVEGNWSALPSDNALRHRQGFSVLGWAIKEVAKHPLRYARAVCGRLARVIGWNPILFLLAGIGLLFSPLKPRLASLSLLAAYLLFIHCLMAVEFNYFAPLRPLLAVFASLPLASLLAPREKTVEIKIFLAALAAVLLLCPFIFERVLSYPRAAASPTALADALGKNPHNGWLLHEKGLRDLDGGNAVAAAAELSRASRFLPSSPYSLDAAWAAALSGRTKALMDFNFPMTEAPGSMIIERAYLMKALLSFKLHRLRQGRVFLRRALALAVSHAFVRDPSSPMEFAATETLRLASIRSFHAQFLGLAGLLPIDPPTKAVFDRELTAVSSAKAPAAGGARTRRGAGLLDIPPAFPSTSYLSNPQEYLRWMALTLQDWNLSRNAALQIFNFLTKRYPNDEIYRRDLAVCEYLTGAHERARNDLKSALRLNPHDPSAYLSLAAADSSRGDIVDSHKDCQGALRNIAWDFKLAPAIYNTCNGNVPTE